MQMLPQVLPQRMLQPLLRQMALQMILLPQRRKLLPPLQLPPQQQIRLLQPQLLRPLIHG
jgi:hypothetical protein